MRRFLLTLLASVFTCAVAAAPFDCGPMLLAPGPRSMNVMVHQADPVSATLTWQREGDAHALHTVVQPATTHHLFTLSGLVPGATYHYLVTGDGGLNSEAWSFRTPPGIADHYKLVALGDLRSQPEQWGRVAGAVRTRECDALAIVTTGDFPSDGTDYDAWRKQFFAPGRALLASLPTIPCIGNHERSELRGGGANPKSDYYVLFAPVQPRNPKWYRVDCGLHTLLVLDSCTAMEKGSPQYEWLLRQLRSCRRRWTLVAFHHPVYTSGFHGRLNRDTKRPAERPIRIAQEEWRPLFERYGVDLVLNGHDHFYEHSHHNGIDYVVTGGAGAPLYSPNVTKNPWQVKAVKAHHYCRIEVSRERLVVTALQPDGTVIDRFTVEKG